VLPVVAVDVVVDVGVVVVPLVVLLRMGKNPPNKNSAIGKLRRVVLSVVAVVVVVVVVVAVVVAVVVVVVVVVVVEELVLVLVDELESTAENPIETVIQPNLNTNYQANVSYLENLRENRPRRPHSTPRRPP